MRDFKTKIEAENTLQITYPSMGYVNGQFMTNYVSKSYGVISKETVLKDLAEANEKFQTVNAELTKRICECRTNQKNF
jgi:hypothetical protein